MKKKQSPKRSKDSLRGLRKNFPNYAGSLVKPLPRPLLLSPDTEWDAWIEALQEKMRSLMAHFEIDPADPCAFGKVAFELAFRHVRGFGPPSRKGRPRERDYDDFRLVMLFSLLTKGYGMSQIQASAAIESDRCIAGKSTTLKRRYVKAKKTWDRFFQNIFDHVGKERFVTGFENIVDDFLPPPGAKTDSISPPAG